MNAIDGGIRMSVAAAAPTTLAENAAGYPALAIAAIITPPTAAAVAGPEPEMPPSTIATRIATAGKVPGARPTQASAKVTMRRATPERSKIEPTRTNIGKASNGYLAMLACMFCGAASSPHHGEAALAAPIAIMPPRPSATAIGTPASIRPTNRRTSRVAIIFGSPALTSERRLVVGRIGGLRVPAPGVPAGLGGPGGDRQAERRNRHGEPPARHAQPHRGLGPADLVGDSGAEEQGQSQE